MLAEPSLQGLRYLLDKRVFDGRQLKDESLAILAARVGEARSEFLSALLQAGVEATADRQLFANALLRGVREGKITCGWKRSEPDVCTHCGKLPNKDKKLLTCGRCKVAKYCNGTCQKAHWAAGHKGACKAPALTDAQKWAVLDEGNGESNAFPSAYKKEVSVGGWGGHPVLGMKGEVIDRRE